MSRGSVCMVTSNLFAQSGARYSELWKMVLLWKAATEQQGWVTGHGTWLINASNTGNRARLREGDFQMVAVWCSQISLWYHPEIRLRNAPGGSIIRDSDYLIFSPGLSSAKRELGIIYVIFVGFPTHLAPKSPRPPWSHINQHFKWYNTHGLRLHH